MRIHVLSDLHTEMDSYLPHQVESDIVVLAGDIGSGAKGIEWAKHIWPDQEIIYVLGNHEYYHMERMATLQAMRDTRPRVGCAPARQQRGCDRWDPLLGQHPVDGLHSVW